MKLIIVNLCFLLLLANIGKSQNYNNPFPNIVQPSPNAASLGRYAEIPVSFETGVPNISVPIYTIQSSGTTLPLSISYHASGIKVMDQASAVGLGWTLNAGGSITRIKQGIYDERPNGFYNVLFPDRQDPNYDIKKLALYAGMSGNLHNQMDGQPDIFYYNFGGKSGKFMFNNRVAKGLPPEISTFPYVPLKITFLDDWKTIQIIDEDGTLYVFGKSLQGVDYREQSTWGSAGPTNEDGYPYTSTWHLTNIVSANKANSISFKYDVSYTAYMNNLSNSINEEFELGVGNTIKINSAPSTSNTLSSSTCKLLSEIAYPNGKVLFSYSTNSGTQIRQLDNIKIYNTKGLLKTFLFSYSKFKNNGIEVKEKNALRLDNCREISASGQQSQPYVFSYFSHDRFEVPPFNEYSEDLWGYFNNSGVKNRLLVQNNNSSNTSTTPMTSIAGGRKANNDYLKVGTLKSLKYPTGGETQFTFEPNQIQRDYIRNDTTFTWFSKNISNIYAGAGDIGYATLTFNDPKQLMTQSIFLFAEIPPKMFYYNVVFRFRVNRFCNPSTDPNCVGNRIDVSLTDLTTGGTLHNWQWDGDFIQNPTLNSKTHEVYLTLDPTHRYQLKFNGANTLNNNNQSFEYRLDASLSGKYNDFTVKSTPVSETVLCGGLRIKEQRSSDPLTGEGYIKSYNYLKPYFNSILFDGDFDKLARRVFAYDKHKNIGSGGTTVQFRTYTENLTVPIGSANNSSVSYEQVEESQTDMSNQTNGKTVYTFRKETDWVTHLLPFYKFDNGDIRSQLLNKKVYSSCRLPLFRTVCKYTNTKIILACSFGNGIELC